MHVKPFRYRVKRYTLRIRNLQSVAEATGCVKLWASQVAIKNKRGGEVIAKNFSNWTGRRRVTTNGTRAPAEAFASNFEAEKKCGAGTRRREVVRLPSPSCIESGSPAEGQADKVVEKAGPCSF